MIQQILLLPPRNWPKTPGTEYANFSNQMTISGDRGIERLSQSKAVPEVRTSLRASKAILGPTGVQPTPVESRQVQAKQDF